MKYRLNFVVVMVVVKLESYQKIAIFRNVSELASEFLKSPNSESELLDLLHQYHKDTQSFNYAVCKLIEIIQEYIINEKQNLKEEQEFVYSNLEDLSYSLQEKYLREIIQNELKYYYEVVFTNQNNFISLKELLFYQGDCIFIIPDLIAAKELIDTFLESEGNEINKQQLILSLLLFLKHQKEFFEDNVFSKAGRLQIVPLIQLYDLFSFHLGQIKEMLAHYQRSFFSTSFSELSSITHGNTFIWEGSQIQLKKLYSELLGIYIDENTEYETFEFIFSNQKIQNIKSKVKWIFTNEKNGQPNRLSLKTLIQSLSDYGLVKRMYGSNSRATYQILQECFVDVYGNPFSDFRKSIVDYQSKPSRIIYNITKSIK